MTENPHGRPAQQGAYKFLPAHSDWSKLHTHPRSIGVGDLRHRVLPRALTASAHDEEVAPSELELSGPATASRAQQEATGYTE